MVSCTVTILICFVRWRDPSGGHLFCQIFTWGVSNFTGIKIVIKNKQTLVSGQPCVYVGNHQSNLDMLIQANCYPPRTVCIGKKEIIWIPFFGALFYVTGNIFLDRKNHKKAMSGMDNAQEILTQKKISIYMFPEGTRNKSSKTLLPFKRGAFRLAIAAQVPIVPIVSCPVKNFIDSEKRVIHPGTAVVEVLEPLPTVGLVENDIDTLIQKTYDRMQSAFKRLS
jgi:1-acyl-sn-glycerol-3-phosphate acyltransferase